MNDSDVINEMGLKYLNGSGVPINYSTAMNYFKQAAHMGNSIAMINIGILYEKGLGVVQNNYEALGWYKAAANKGNVEAMYLTARLYCESNDIPNHKELAIPFYEEAASAGHQDAMMELGAIYRQHSYLTALKFYLIFAEKGNAKAMCEIGDLYRQGDETVPENIDEALKWSFAALEAKYIKAMYCIGHCLQFDLRDHKNAFKWFKKGAESGDFMCMLELGRYYMNGRWIPQDLDEAKKWLYKAKNLAQELDKKSGNTAYQDWMERDLQNLKEHIRNSWSCFITTAVCENLGKPDDCYELMTFRKFRDTWLINQPDGKSLIDLYYSVAPKIVAKINLRDDSKKIYNWIWEKYLSSCLKYIEQKKYIECQNLYSTMMNELKKFL